LSTTLPTISISIVSHLQAAMVKALLDDLNRCCKTHPLEVLLTLNLPEELPFDAGNYFFPVIVQVNPAPKGFAENQRCRPQGHRKLVFPCHGIQWDKAG
jgi:hypothetical protein